MSDRKQAETSRHGVLSRYTVLPWGGQTNTTPWLHGWLLSMRRRARPRSIWSRNWPASFGATRLPGGGRRRRTG